MRERFIQLLPNPLALDDDAVSLSIKEISVSCARHACHSCAQFSPRSPCLSFSLLTSALLNQFDIKPSVSLKKKLGTSACFLGMLRAVSALRSSHVARRLPRPYAGVRLNFISTFSLSLLSWGNFANFFLELCLVNLKGCLVLS